MNGCGHTPFPLWLKEIVEEPLAKIVTAPMYFTRGYTFQTYNHCSRRSTANYGIHVPGEIDFYGILQEIIEVTYPGLINLKCILFKCDWYDPVIDRGVKTNRLGITEVNARRKFDKFEPFILASQAEQVCFFSYPRIRQKRDMWLPVIKVNPRGRIVGEAEDEPMQHEKPTELSIPIESTEEILHIDPQNIEVEDILDMTDEDAVLHDEFYETDDEADEDAEDENTYISDNDAE